MDWELFFDIILIAHYFILYKVIITLTKHIDELEDKIDSINNKLNKLL